jgi:hypothetical protein
MLLITATLKSKIEKVNAEEKLFVHLYTVDWCDEAVLCVEVIEFRLGLCVDLREQFHR